MSYGYKWFKAEQRYYVGSELPNGDLLKQTSEMQPLGHWVRGEEREFRGRGLSKWEPSWLERFKRWREGWRWHKYPDKFRAPQNLGEHE